MRQAFIHSPQHHSHTNHNFPISTKSLPARLNIACSSHSYRHHGDTNLNVPLALSQRNGLVPGVRTGQLKYNVMVDQLDHQITVRI